MSAVARAPLIKAALSLASIKPCATLKGSSPSLVETSKRYSFVRGIATALF